MADRRELLLDLLARDRASATIKRVGDAAEDAGDSFEEAARDAAKLDREVEQAEASLRELAREFARTDDAARRMDLSKAMRKQQTEMSRLVKAKSLLSPGDAASAGMMMGTRIGVSTAQGFVASFSTSAKGAIGPVGGVLGVAIGVPLAATAGAALTAGLLAAVGGGAVAAGIALALQDSQVKAAATSVGRDIGARLAGAAVPFRAATISALGEISASFGRVEGAVGRIFASASQYVAPLVRGLTGMVERIVPAVERAVSRAAPVISALEQSLPELGDAIGDAFDSISENGPEAAAAIKHIVLGFGEMIRFGGQTISFLSDLYGRLITTGLAAVTFADAITWDHLPVVGAKIAHTRTRLEELKGTMDGARRAALDQAGATDGQGSAATRAAAANAAYVHSLKAVSDLALAAADSEIALEQAIDDAAAAVKTNGKTLDINTQKGRDNKKALYGIATAAKQAAADILAETGSQVEANIAAERGRTKFIALATKMGMTAGEAKNLANKLFGIPSKRDTTANFHDAKARAKVAAYNRMIGRIDRYIPVNIAMRITGASRVASAAALAKQAGGARALGGPVKAGQPYLVGERGPELVMPSQDGHVFTATETARMAGRRPSPAGGGSIAQVVLSPAAGADQPLMRAIIAGLRYAVQTQGRGSVQTLLG